MTLRHAARADLKVSVRVTEPLPAPIARGQQIASLVISAPDMPDREVALLAGADVERQGFFGRILSSAEAMLFGAVTGAAETSTTEGEPAGTQPGIGRAHV